MQQTALLVIDMQRGAFDGARCPPIDEPERLLANVGLLIEAARQGGARVVFVQHCEGAGEPFEEGSEHGKLHASLAPATGDHVLRKYASSSFERTDLDAQLKTATVSELVLCGLQSEFCIANTAKSALQLGYRVRIAQDAHSTWPSGGHSAASIRDQSNSGLAEQGAEVAETARLAADLRLSTASRAPGRQP